MPEEDNEDVGDENVDDEVIEEEIEPKKKVSRKRDAKKKKPNKVKKSIVKKVSIIVILVAILAVVLYFAFKTLQPERVVATVNKEPITFSELDKKYSQLPDQYKLVITKDAFLDQIIHVKLLLQEAKKQGIVVTEEEIETELNNLKKQAPTEEAFEQLLKQKNILISELKKQIEEQLTLDKLLNETVLSKMEISDSKISEYYKYHKNDFQAKPGEIKLRHILVATEDRAKEISKQLQEGKDFEELARLNSIDTTSAINGGDLGFVKKGQTVKEFEDGAFALKVNQLSSIIKTQFGYHIIKREADKIPYNKAKEQIKQILSTEISNNAIEVYINQLRLNSDIVKKGVKVKDKVETFTKTNDTLCKEDDKVIIRLFSTTKNSASKWISETFDSLVKEYGNSIAVYHWQLDTGDNTLTEVQEDGIPEQELEIFKKYSPESKVPVYAFGCKYIRIGNAYSDLEEEKAEFRRLIDQLVI